MPDETRARQLLAPLSAPLRRFVAMESGSASLLLAATVVALAWANSPVADSYTSLWDTEIAMSVGDHELAKDLRHWIDEGLMALFFFVIGLEVRREWSLGELTDRSRVTVPLAAGLGGIVVPALIFLALNPGGEAAKGWGIVIATDTAFLLGALAIVGPAFPTQLRVFLLLLSIVDDLVAISVIGVVYSGALQAVWLGAAAACLATIALLGRVRAWRGSLYVVVGAVLWLVTVESGLHPTIAGMAAGLLVASYAPRREHVEEAESTARAFRQSPVASLARSAKATVNRALAPNERLLTALHPWTSYGVVPLFALANAGVDLRGGALGDALSSPLTWGVVAGLVVGKTVGISALAFGTVRSGLGRLPQGVGGGQVVGGAALSGIGFTVSLLIVELAFDSSRLQDQARVGVLLAAVLATAAAWLGFRLAAVLRGEVSAGLPRVLDRPVDPERDHVQGDPAAPLTLVEYGDFECQFCSRATGVVHELEDRLGDDVRYVFRHLPLVDVHPHAELAAQAAEEAAVQGRFWELHDRLFAHQDRLEFEDLLGHAEAVGLDVEQMAEALEDGRHAERVRADSISAEASGARGTPTFFIGEDRHMGPWDADNLIEALEDSRS